MEQIILPMKVHAVKLEYRRRRLAKMVHGYFAVRQGRDVVVITSDPKMPQYNSRIPRILRTSSARARPYVEAVNSYLQMRSEYDALLTGWNATYRFAPPKVRFPIKQYYDPHHMNNDYFNNQAGNMGKYKSDTPTHSDHGDLKSKNELLGSEALKQMGIPFKYETQIYIPEVDETLNPDYLASFYEIDRCSYIELCGMNDKEGYSGKTATKINSYARGRYRQGREIIYVHLYDKNNFDSVVFAEQVLSAYDSMIPFSALDWGSEPVVFEV